MCPDAICLSTAFFGQLEDVGGPVVAIHAIHHAILSFFQLLLSWLGIGGNEFGRLPLIVGVIDDWNRLPLNIGGDVADPRAVSEMMTVDADRALPGASADFQQ